LINCQILCRMAFQDSQTYASELFPCVFSAWCRCLYPYGLSAIDKYLVIATPYCDFGCWLIHKLTFNLSYSGLPANHISLCHHGIPKNGSLLLLLVKLNSANHTANGDRWISQIYCGAYTDKCWVVSSNLTTIDTTDDTD
jgi:hypothetical protein